MSKQKTENELKLGLQWRELQIDNRQIDEENRTVELSFSSEEPVDRWWGKEILDHSEESVRLQRLNSRSPLLMDHNSRDQIGVIESARIEGKRGKALVRFSKSKRAEEIWQDVKDGIRSLVSVGYRIFEMVLEKQSEDKPDEYRVTDWEPLEVSIVSVPADITVGIGREDEDEKLPVKIINERGINMPEPEVKTEQPQVQTTAPPAIDPEKEKRAIREKELNRAKEIRAIAAQFDMVEAGEKAIREDVSVDSFRGLVLERLKTEKHIDTKTAHLGMSEKEVSDYSLLRAIRATITSDWSQAGLEREASEAMAKLLKRDPRSFFVPEDVKFNKRDISTSSGGSGLVATDHMPQNFIEALRNRAKVVQLGAFTLTGLQGNVSIPKQTGAATAYWVTEGGNVTESASAYGNLAMSPKTVAGRVDYTRRMLLQSNPSIEALVINDLINVLTLAIDAAAINGSGASGQPTGVLNTSGIGAVTTGGAIAWSHILEFESDVAAANADIDVMAYLTNASIRGTLKGTKKDSGSGIFLWEGNEMNGYRAEVSNQVPASTMIFGVWSQILIGLWSGLDIQVDTTTLGDSGGVVIRAFQDADIGIRHAAAFSAATDI